MILTADQETRTVTDEQGNSLNFDECMRAVADGEVDDMTVKTQRLLSYGGDWFQLDQFYKDNP